MLNVGKDLVSGVLGQNTTGKIKGTVILMSKKVLDFNNLLSIKAGINLGVNTVNSTVDTVHQFLGGAVSLQLVSATKADPGNGLGKVGKAAPLTMVPTWSSLTEKEYPFNVEFEYDEEMGVPGAFVIKNSLLTEFFLVSVTLDDIPNNGSLHFVCNSWIYPDSYYKQPRIFFPNKAYLPSETPEALRKYREQELVTLRGDGISECKEWDRVYDFAVYNDLGNPDSIVNNVKDMVRPTLGGSSEYPYPRRGRTSRPPNKSDPSTESRLSLAQNFEIYVPRDERFAHVKLSDFLGYFIKSIAQDLRPLLESAFKLSNEFDSFEDVRQLYEGGIKLPLDVFKNITDQMSIPILQEIFRTDGEQSLSLPKPAVIKENLSGWMTDEEFAREVIAGVNPAVICKLQEFPPKSQLDASVYGDQTSKITKEQLEKNMDGVTVDEAISGSRLFLLDHHDAFMPYLRRINSDTGNTAYASRTIFFLQDDGTLKPLAIELSLPHPDGDQYGAVSKVYLPATDGVQATIWLLAKAYVVVNDSGYHQLVSHWLHTHAVIEPFVIATNRQLSVLHPIHKLLHPHYRDTMNINALARQALINGLGIIELSFLPGKYSMEISSKVYKNWVFTDQALPADLIKRGMAVEDSPSPHGLRLVIEDYPYAIDGLEIWAAIKTWVSDYVSCYYQDDDAVKQDPELQAWWKELVEVGHGDLKDQPWWPKMETRDELIESCTIVIWTASALHASVNFGQYPYGGYILNRPTLSRRLMPEEGTPEYDELKTNPEKAFLRTITPKVATLIDLSVIEILSRHTSDEVYLGKTDDPKWTADAKPLEAFQKFGKKLAEIEEKLITRNSDETLRNRVGPVNMPYTLLYPSSEEGLTGRGIPNSVSI